MPITLPVQLGEPRTEQGITLVPLFPRTQPRAHYLTLDVAATKGLTVDEVSEAGSVPELVVTNPLAHDVLLFDGEELIGAKQNRILNISVLVAAGSTTRVPVSCVEVGRWSRSGRFAVASHAANPELRRRKAVTLHDAPTARGIAQNEVWDTVAATAAEAGVASRTGAHADTFAARRTTIDEIATAFPLQPGQCGAIVLLPSSACLDYVSRPDAWAGLSPRLLRGYLFDSVAAAVGGAPSPNAAEGLVASLAGATATRRPSPGRGEDVRAAAKGVTMTGLEVEGELVQVSA